MKISNLTKVSLYACFSIGLYAFLTAPNLIYDLTNGRQGFEYEMDLSVIAGIWSALIGCVIANFIIKEIKNENL